MRHFLDGKAQRNLRIMSLLEALEPRSVILCEAQAAAELARVLGHQGDLVEAISERLEMIFE